MKLLLCDRSYNVSRQGDSESTSHDLVGMNDVDGFCGPEERGLSFADLISALLHATMFLVVAKSGVVD